MYDIHGKPVRDGWHTIKLGALVIRVFAHQGWLHCAIRADGLERWGMSGLADYA